MPHTPRVALLAGALLVTGCYTLQPIGGAAPAAGRRMAFDVNDAGRLALGGTMGPSIARVEGRLLRQESDAYVVAVTSVDFIAGNTQQWSGETVRLQPGYVGTVYERRLSKGRTVAAAALGAGAIAFIVTRSVTGGGDPSDNRQPSDTGRGTIYRGRRP